MTDIDDHDLDGVDAALLDEVADDLAWLDRVGRDWPLALWTAWHCAGGTSQWRALMGLGQVVTFLFGGNRSGKTAGLKALVVAHALGSDHPMVRLWLALNGYPEDMIPAGPGRVWLIAKTSNDSVRYHRPDIDRLLPRGMKRWWNRDGRGEARVFIECPGYDYPAEIWFKSEDQGREGMQGDHVRMIGVDEEINEGVWNELLLRIADESGRIICAMTPLKGKTWVYRRYSGQSGPAEEGSRAHWLDATDNPHMPADFLRRLYRGMSAEEIAARKEGRFVAMANRVYPAWASGIHITDGPVEIEPDWPRYCGLDFGARHQTCVLWGALGPDGRLYIYRELYAAGLTTSQLARRIHEAEGGRWIEERDLEPGEHVPPELSYLVEQRGQRRILAAHWDDTGAERIVARWGDPSARQTIRDLRSYGIVVRKARRDWIAGCGAVTERLGLEIDGEPRLQVVRTASGRPAAPGLVAEIESYCYPEGETSREHPPPRPQSGDDAMDSLRYLSMGVRHL